MQIKLLSIIIPCYNEINTINEIIGKVKNVTFIKKEIILIDDGSTDGTTEYIKKNIESEIQKTIYHKKNQGKGAAIRTGIAQASGDVIIIQDADLEYDPLEYVNLLEPIINKGADVVYGSRFLGGGKSIRIHFFWHYLANKFLTLLTNIFTNLNMSDMETCYKVFKRDQINKIVLKENSFGIEPEITIKLSKISGIVFYEVPISYYGRGYHEGKKIKMSDAFIAVYCIFKYYFFTRKIK